MPNLFNKVQEFVNDLFSTLRERGLELKSGVVVFVRGGAVLLKRQIEASGKVANPVLWRISGPT